MTITPTSRVRRTAAVLALAAIAVTGCQGVSAPGGDTAPDGAYSQNSDTGGQPSGGGAPWAEQDASGSVAGDGSAASTAVAPSVVTTGWAAVRSEDPTAAAQEFQEVTIALGGRVAESETSQAGDFPRATVTVRVPAERYQELVDGLADLGDVIEQSSNSTDVGQQLADLQARRNALQASIDRLTELMATSETTADLLEAEAMITARQAELDSLVAQLTYLESQVAMSTLTVEFATEAAATVYRQPSVWERSWRYFLDSAEGLLLTFMALLPWALVIGVVVWVIVALVRGRRRGMPRRYQDYGPMQHRPGRAEPGLAPAPVQDGTWPDDGGTRIPPAVAVDGPGEIDTEAADPPSTEDGERH